MAGARGPKPLPTNVHLLRGNPSKLRADELSGQVNPEIEIPGCPAHLLPEARRFWKLLTPELEKLRLVAKIDQAALALVCQEWGWLAWHEKLLKRDVDRATKAAAAWEDQEDRNEAAAKELGQLYARKPFAGGDGFQIPTPNGNLTYNPHWVARNKHALLLDKFLASFGMSPSSRGRVTPSSRQLELPGVGGPPAGGFGAL